MTDTSPNNPALLSVRGLCKAFAGHAVLQNLDLDIYPGEVLAILGPSGSGKTTLLRCLNALEQPERGTLRFGDGSLSLDFSTSVRQRQLLALRRKSGMVFQAHNLFPHKNALENVMEGPLVVQKRPRAEVEHEARALLAKVGLADQSHHYPYQLSGGQQQRVGIARALALQPKLVLFDEPTSALDPELVQGLLETLKTLAQEGWTMVVVTHEIRFARDVAHQVLLMEGGQIVEQGPPQQLFGAAKHPRTKAFLEAIGSGVYVG